MNPEDLQVGQRIKVTQQVARRERTWTTEVIGTILELKDETTGSWYAHSKNNKYWLRRIRLRKDDGELTTVSLDRLSRVELLDSPAAQPS
jgi:hypothetical protein